ncbi:MAG: hypothetical protein ACR2MP_05710 [Streptosporangiaceae bacterium]
MAALRRRAIHRRTEQPPADREDLGAGMAVAAIEAAGGALLGTSLPPGGSFDRPRRFRSHRAGRLTVRAPADVPPTTNASERRLRPAVVHRQVTGGFRAAAAAKG